jgi:hypothetical protein
MTGMTAAIVAELERIEEDCTFSAKGQFNAAERWTRYHYLLGLPSVGLSAFAGAAFLKDAGMIGAALSAVVATLTTIITFLKPSERSSGHKVAGDQYLSLRNDARVFRLIKLQHACDAEAAIGGLDELTKRRNELNQASSPFSRADFEKARRGIEEGEAAHLVDRSFK